MTGWETCIHWRICPKKCPEQIDVCGHYAPAKSKAKWIFGKGGTWISCSGCGAAFKEETKYCPNCGAEMGE